MDHKAFFMKYWEKEAAATRKVIARVPQERSDYRADPKARTALEIAWLLVHEEAILADGLVKGVFEWVDAPAPATIEAILEVYDRQHAESTRRLQGLAGERWDREVAFMWQGQEVQRDTGGGMAWGFLLDQIHHRGQLSTYLRPMGSTVPAIYGPSADEGM